MFFSGIIYNFDLEKFKSKKCKYTFLYQKFVHLDENTFKYCSRICVLHVYATGFPTVHPACHNIANGIKSEIDSKSQISMLQIAQKLYVWA